MTLTAALLSSCSRQKEEAATQQATSKLLCEAPQRGDYILQLYCTPAEPSITDEIILEYVCIYPTDATATPAAFDKSHLQSLELLRQENTATSVLADGKYRTSWRLILEPQLLDTDKKYLIPQQIVAFKLANGEEMTMSTDECELQIPQPSAEELSALQINDALPRVTELRTPWERVRMPLCIALIAIVILCVLFVLFRVYRNRSSLETVVTLTPYERAIRDLDALLQKQLPRNGEYKAYYTGVSAILRQYIEARFALHAPKLTTEEFLRELASRATVQLRSNRARLQEFLTACDLVKFAEQIPSDDQSAHLADSCREFLDATRPQDESNGENKADV